VTLVGVISVPRSRNPIFIPLEKSRSYARHCSSVSYCHVRTFFSGPCTAVSTSRCNVRHHASVQVVTAIDMIVLVVNSRLPTCAPCNYGRIAFVIFKAIGRRLTTGATDYFSHPPLANFRRIIGSAPLAGALVGQSFRPKMITHSPYPFVFDSERLADCVNATTANEKPHYVQPHPQRRLAVGEKGSACDCEMMLATSAAPSISCLIAVTLLAFASRANGTGRPSD
jgi:hypothetical protein